MVVRPADLDRFGLFDTKNFDEIEAAGHAAALEHMPEILAAIGRDRT